MSQRRNQLNSGSVLVFPSLDHLIRPLEHTVRMSDLLCRLEIDNPAVFSLSIRALSSCFIFWPSAMRGLPSRHYFLSRLYRSWVKPLSSSSLTNRISTKSSGFAAFAFGSVSPNGSRIFLIPSRVGYCLGGSISSLTPSS